LFREQQTEHTSYKLVRASSIFLSVFLERKGLRRYGASGVIMNIPQHIIHLLLNELTE
jgi:hypothetical protein